MTAAAPAAAAGPHRARVLSWRSLRWVVRHRAVRPYHLVRYWRFLVFRLRHPHVVTEGFVFLGKGVQVQVRPGYGRLVLGRWVHVGDHSALRAHEGTLRVGDKVVIGRDSQVNCWLDVEIGASTLVSDWVYVCDFDHRTEDLDAPIKDQGIVKSPVRIGPDTWVGTKVTVTRGVSVGRGAVLAANSVVNRDVPAYAVAGGVPARVLRDRRSEPDRATRERARDRARRAVRGRSSRQGREARAGNTAARAGSRTRDDHGR